MSLIKQVISIEDGKTLKRREEGEICVKGPQVMLGYLDNDKATNDMIDKDGWLKTGYLLRMCLRYVVFYLIFNNIYIYRVYRVLDDANISFNIQFKTTFIITNLYNDNYIVITNI